MKNAPQKEASWGITVANNGSVPHPMFVLAVAYDLIQGIYVSSDEVSGAIKDSLKACEVVSRGEVYTPDFSGFPPHTVQQQAPQVDGRR